MDHCPLVEPNNQKIISSKLTKHIMKAWKKRLMEDICVVTPTRTPEDLEQSTPKLLALEDANLLKLDMNDNEGSN